MSRTFGRTIIIAMFAGFVALHGVAADVGGQIVGFAAAAVVENPHDVNDLGREYENASNEDRYGGIEGEIWFDHLGFGLRHGGRFTMETVEVLDESESPAISSQRDAWWYEGYSDIFVSFHLFGGGSFIDPYIRYGGGVDVKSSITTDFGYDRDREVWTTEKAAEDDDDMESEERVDRVGVYQYLGAGAQLNLAGLVLGTGVDYNVIYQNVGGFAFDGDTFSPHRFTVRIYGGIAF